MANQIKLKALLLCSLLFSATIALAHPLSSDEAVAYLMSVLEQDKVYTACFFVWVDGKTQRTIEVSLHEVHNASCGGDPATAPRLDSFKIDRRTRKLEWYDIAEDSYRPYRIFKAQRMNTSNVAEDLRQPPASKTTEVVAPRL